MWSSTQPLFVTAAVPRLHTGRGTCGRPTLKLTGTLDEQCRWTVVYWDAGMQMKSEGLPVPVRKTYNSLARSRPVANRSERGKKINRLFS
jgi:hypothetical protein